MKHSSKLLLILASFFLSLGMPAWADLTAELEKEQFVDKQFVKEEAAAVKRLSEEWAKRLNAHQPVKISALYGDSFILYATFSNKIDTREALHHYFVTLMKKKDLKVVFNEQNIRVHGAGAVDSGLYTFSFTDEKGKKVEVPARYTFVYELSPEGWKIVDHHSSVLPE
jgi:uncharacterized protein (TIGR02246 family)